MDSTEDKSQRKTSSRRIYWWLLLAFTLATGGVLGARAYAFGGMPGFGPGDSPEEHKAFMQRRLDKMLGEVKAADGQRSAIKNIALRLHAELEPIQKEHGRLREGITKAFAAQTIDAAAIEKLRMQAIDLMDRGSQVFARALVDVANVLDAGQRQTLIGKLQKLHGHEHHGH